MQHLLVSNVEKALGWSGPGQLGTAFAHGSLPDLGLCRRLLTPTRLLDLVMRRPVTAGRVRCLQHGQDVHPHAYLAARLVRRAEAEQQVDMHRLGLLLKEGCTLVVDGVDGYDPTLEVACRALQWWARELVHVNVYLTTGDASGFPLHWDDHDVLVVQLAGSKSWEIRQPSRVAPMYRDATPNRAAPEDSVWAGELRAGEVMHIPRGWWHQATRRDRGKDGFSLHATFGFPQRTGVDWLAWIADYARRDELFRHDLSHNSDADWQRALNAAAARLVAATPVGEYLAARQQHRPAARHVATHGLFGPLDAVVCITEFPPDLHASDGLVTVRAAGKEITFTAAALPVLQLLLAGHPVSITQVSTKTGIDAAAVAAALMEAGICAEATPELTAGYITLFTPAAP